jgi:hypothetical protein
MVVKAAEVDVAVTGLPVSSMVVKAALASEGAPGDWRGRTAAPLFKLPPAVGVVDALVVVRLLEADAEGKTVAPPLAPFARRLESKLEASSGESVCVCAGRVKVTPEARMTVSVAVAPSPFWLFW